jgi:hypothetical protein
MEPLKKILILSCLLIAASCIHSKAPLNSNLGPNMGFEYTENGLPVNWIYYIPPEFEQKISVDSGNPKEGKQSLRFDIRKSPEEAKLNFSGFCREFPEETKGGGKYRISFWVKNQGITCSFLANGVNAKNKAPQQAERTESGYISDWQKMEIDCTVPKDMWLRLEVRLKGKGSFWMDCAAIEKL